MRSNFKTLLDMMKDNSKQRGLNMNVSKPKVTVMSKHPETKFNICVNGKKLEQVHTFKYLGQKVQRMERIL